MQNYHTIVIICTMYIHRHPMFPCLLVFKGVPFHYSKFNRTTNPRSLRTCCTVSKQGQERPRKMPKKSLQLFTINRMIFWHLVIVDAKLAISCWAFLFWSLYNMPQLRKLSLPESSILFCLFYETPSWASLKIKIALQSFGLEIHVSLPKWETKGSVTHI